MGVHSTLSITKGDAVSLLVKQIIELSEDDLEQLLFDLIGNDRLYHFRIVSEYTETDDYTYKPNMFD